MRQRTCSHRISELYNEIILSSKFKDEYIAQESFYLNNIYVTIFKNTGYKAKLLIINKENQNIIFENICDNTFLIHNSIQEDAYLYSIDIEYSIIHKFNNPILNNGIIKDSINIKYPFIALSKSINDIIIKDEILYFSVNITGIRVEEDKKISINLTKEKNYVTTIDKIAEDFVFQEITALIGINSNDLIETDRDVFNGHKNPIKFLEKKINRKNSLIIEVFDGYYMEYFSHLIDYSLGINKRLHPKFHIEIGNKYLLVLPEYYDYNVYSDFKLIRLSDLKEFDFCRIFNVENQLNPNKYSLGEFDLINIKFLNDDLLTIGDYEFSCENLLNKSSNIF